MSAEHQIPPLREWPNESFARHRSELIAEASGAQRRLPSHRLILVVALALATAGGASWAAVTTQASGGLSGPTVPASILNSRVSAAGYAGNGIWTLTATGLKMEASSGGLWTDITPTGVQAGHIQSAYFADTSNGWLATYSPQQKDGVASILVYRTTDGGTSWLASTVDTSTLLGQSEDGPIWLSFVNDSDGWLEAKTISGAAFSNANLYRTTDGGATWTALQIPIAGTLTFNSPEDGFVAGGPVGNDLYATTDGGSSWTAVNLPGPTGNIYGPVFTSPTDGLVSVTATNASGTTVGVYRTTDGGATWTSFGSVTVSADQAGQSTPVAAVGSGWLASVGSGSEAWMQGGSVSAVSPTGLPDANVAGIASLDFQAGANAGLALVQGGVCRSFKGNCVQIGALYATADGGASWSQLNP